MNAEMYLNADPSSMISASNQTRSSGQYFGKIRSGPASQYPPELCKLRCHFCDYATHKSYNLAKHIRVHTGEMPFGCQLCNYKCCNKSNLSRHMAVKHPEIKTFSKMQ